MNLLEKGENEKELGFINTTDIDQGKYQPLLERQEVPPELMKNIGLARWLKMFF